MPLFGTAAQGMDPDTGQLNLIIPGIDFGGPATRRIPDPDHVSLTSQT